MAHILKGSVIRSMIQTRHLTIKINPAGDFTDNESVLHLDLLEYVPVTKVHRHRSDMGFNYASGSKVSFRGDPRELGPLIRRVFILSKAAIMPPCLVPPVPGVLEVEKFGRQELVKRFVLSEEGSVRSLPCFNF